jgi:RHS repeat-associated protein
VREFIVTRHNADGTYDTSFSGDGKLAVDYGATYALDLNAAVVVDGRIVAVGCKDTGTMWGEDFAVVVLEGGERLEERLWAVHDANWNITAVTSTSGTVVQRSEYDPYGAATFLTHDYQPSTNNWQLLQGFQGLRIDTITGWWDARNRWLIPSLQTWNRMDPHPAGPYVDGMTGYGVLRGNPLGGVDPWGLENVGDKGTLYLTWPGICMLGLDNSSVGSFFKIGDSVAKVIDIQMTDIGWKDWGVGLAGRTWRWHDYIWVVTYQITKTKPDPFECQVLCEHYKNKQLKAILQVIDDNKDKIYDTYLYGALIGMFGAFRQFKQVFGDLQSAMGSKGVGGYQVLDTVATKNAAIRAQGFTKTMYVRGSDGMKYTIFYNPRTGQYTGIH